MEHSVFEQNRRRLWGIAYRMLGSRADAEDMVQETWLRWHGAVDTEIRLPRAWLVTTVTRLCIDRLRKAPVEREAYVGPWLPEPLVAESVPGADEAAELASDLSVAFLALLERLAPEERAAFLLHEVFESGYDDIAAILRKSEATNKRSRHEAAYRFCPGVAESHTGHVWPDNLCQ
jgi:RNA polymerase sigma-70 factor, ECF subfamily